jgi:hypothetical protein
MALRQNLESGTIDVYAHSAHNHPIEPEGRGGLFLYVIFSWQTSYLQCNTFSLFGNSENMTLYPQAYA